MSQAGAPKGSAKEPAKIFEKVIGYRGTLGVITLLPDVVQP